jgi:hypothetical protein
MEHFMKKSSMIAFLLLAAGLSTGCNTAKDKILPDGTKLFGHIRLKDGTEKAVRLESPDGSKQFDVTWLSDGSGKAARVAFPDGERKFDATWFSDGHEKAGRVEYPNGETDFDVTWLPDGSKNVARATFPDGTQRLNIDTPWHTVELFPLPRGEAWGYVDKTGKFVIEPQFEYASAFSEGLAAIKVAGKYGFINEMGGIVINPQFDDKFFVERGL